MPSGEDGPEGKEHTAFSPPDGPDPLKNRYAPWAQYAHKTPCITYHKFSHFDRVRIDKIPAEFIEEMPKTPDTKLRFRVFCINIGADFVIIR